MLVVVSLSFTVDFDLFQPWSLRFFTAGGNNFPPQKHAAEGSPIPVGGSVSKLVHAVFLSVIIALGLYGPLTNYI